VIKLNEHIPNHVLEQAEIDEDPDPVKFFPGKKNLNRPVMTMRIGALPPVIFQMVRRGKMSSHAQFVHGYFFPPCLIV
jgi:hypothetical protein